MTKIQKHLRATGRIVQTWLSYIPVLLLGLVILAVIVGFLRQFLAALSRIDTAQVIALGVVYAMFAALFKGAEESDRNSPDYGRTAGLGIFFFIFLGLWLFLANTICIWFPSFCPGYTPSPPDYSPGPWW